MIVYYGHVYHSYSKHVPTRCTSWLRVHPQRLKGSLIEPTTQYHETVTALTTSNEYTYEWQLAE